MLADSWHGMVTCITEESDLFKAVDGGSNCDGASRLPFSCVMVMAVRLTERATVIYSRRIVRTRGFRAETRTLARD